MVADRAYFGAIAQLGERLPCTQEVCGSIPHSSTSCRPVVQLVSVHPLLEDEERGEVSDLECQGRRLLDIGL